MVMAMLTTLNTVGMERSSLKQATLMLGSRPGFKTSEGKLISKQ